MLNESAHHYANHRVNANNPYGDIEREGQTETALVERLPDHVFEGREFVAFQYAEDPILRPGVIGESRARLPRETGRDDGEFPEISQITCHFGNETACPTDTAVSKMHDNTPRHGKGPAWNSIRPKGDPRQSDDANTASPPGRRRYLRYCSAVKETGAEPGQESPGIATVALLAEARGFPYRQRFRQACAERRRVYTVRGHGLARVQPPGFVFPAVRLERPRMIADGP